MTCLPPPLPLLSCPWCATACGEQSCTPIAGALVAGTPISQKGLPVGAAGAAGAGFHDAAAWLASPFTPATEVCVGKHVVMVLDFPLRAFVERV